MQLFLGILLLVMSIFLIVAVLFQQGKSHRLPGAIAGGAETFFGKSKSKGINAILSKLTMIVAIIFVIVVIVVYIMTASNSTAPEIVTGDNTDVTENVEGETVEGETAEGETAEGETAEGETVEGETAEGETAEGETAEGETAEGETAEGETAEGETVEGETAEGEAATEGTEEAPVEE